MTATKRYRIKTEYRADGSCWYWVQYHSEFLWWSWWSQLCVTSMHDTWPVGYNTYEAALEHIKKEQAKELAQITTYVKYKEIH